MRLDQEGHAIYWAPGEIRFNLDEVYFLLENLYTLRECSYPLDPAGNNLEVRAPGFNTKAPFTTAAEIAAELDRRIKACWPDCYLLEDYYAKGRPISEIARVHHLEPGFIYKRIERAVNYIASGPVPRWITTDKRRGLEYLEYSNRHYRKSENMAIEAK
jgi:hypothetical protein